jgi:hypothetical protein
MRGLAGVWACVVAASALAGCGDGGGSSSKAGTETAPRTTTVRAAVNPSLKKNLGKAYPGQLRRAQAYTTCLARRVRRIKLTFREGTALAPPVIIGAIRGTRFGINLGSSPANAKKLERKLHAAHNNAVYRRGSTVIGFAGSHPTGADIAILTGCADRIG